MKRWKSIQLSISHHVFRWLSVHVSLCNANSISISHYAIFAFRLMRCYLHAACCLQIWAIFASRLCHAACNIEPHLHPDFARCRWILQIVGGILLQHRVWFACWLFALLVDIAKTESFCKSYVGRSCKSEAANHCNSFVVLGFELAKLTFFCMHLLYGICNWICSTLCFVLTL